MDGASFVSRFIYITLPHLARAITVVILIQTIFLLGVFAEILVTTNGGPGYASTNLAFLIYRTALLELRRRRRLGRRRHRGHPRQHRRLLPDARRRQEPGRVGGRPWPAPSRPAARSASPSLAWVVALLIFFPILWTILTSFKTEARGDRRAADLFSVTGRSRTTSRCRRSATTSSRFMNSVIIAVGSTLLGAAHRHSRRLGDGLRADQAHQGHPDVDALDQDDAGGRRAGADLPHLPRSRPARHAGSA